MNGVSRDTRGNNQGGGLAALLALLLCAGCATTPRGLMSVDSETSRADENSPDNAQSVPVRTSKLSPGSRFLPATEPELPPGDMPPPRRQSSSRPIGELELPDTVPGGSGIRRAGGSLTQDIDPAELNEPIHQVVVEGNKTIPADEIARKIKTRAGRPVDANQIKEDVRSLYASRWFFNVETEIRRGPDGPVLVFKVLERPILQKVEFKGNNKIKSKDLQELTGLKPGVAFDVGANKESARRIESHYHEKGYVFAQVELERGGSKDDRDVVFLIKEGPKVHVTKIDFQGNSFANDAILKTKVRTKIRKFFLFGGKYDPATIPEDISILKDYYHGLGFFDVDVKHAVKLSKDQSEVHIDFIIDEGMRYKVREVRFTGNRVIKESELRSGLKLVANDFFSDRKLSADVEKITSQYGELGRIFARVEAVPVHTEKNTGTFDLVYEIDEDRPRKIGQIRVHIQGDHPHTKESVVLNRLRFRPGELANMTKIKKSEQALKNSQVFAGATPGQTGDPPRISVTPAELYGLQDADLSVARGQAYDGELTDDPALIGAPRDFGGPQGPFYEGQPPSFIDSDVYVSETQTGRLMFGVGVNSNAGVLGNIVLEENNFDLFHPPSSFQDFVDGTAWRGGGQQFRIEAVPGNQLSRYLISWRDPYFLDQNVSFGVSGFYYTRFFPNWLEERLGGRVTVGRQFTPELSGAVAVRAENVDVSQPGFPTPQSLADVLGNNFLSTIRTSVVHDTRDSPFLPGSGHYLEAAYEQGIADFVYPRFELDGRQYFTIYERPDGGSRQTLGISGQFGWTDNETPIFEKYYAGGFASLRGFQFYGVTPREFGIRTGGRFQALGSVEYMVPVTADNMIQVVGFTDFGTVDDEVTLDNFRLSVGGGLRLTIPAMGPFPIALDFGVPIVRQDFDNTQLFSFYVGVQR
jgi:outer membrane protein insertion porin family